MKKNTLKAPIAAKYEQAGAYKGYTISIVLHLARVWIEKDSHFIAWSDSIASAKATIDELTAPCNPAPRLLYSTTSREAADERIRCAVRNCWNVVECTEDASGLINIIFEKAQQTLLQCSTHGASFLPACSECQGLYPNRDRAGRVR